MRVKIRTGPSGKLTLLTWDGARRIGCIEPRLNRFRKALYLLGLFAPLTPRNQWLASPREIIEIFIVHISSIVATHPLIDSSTPDFGEPGFLCA